MVRSLRLHPVRGGQRSVESRARGERWDGGVWGVKRYWVRGWLVWGEDDARAIKRHCYGDHSAHSAAETPRMTSRACKRKPVGITSVRNEREVKLFVLTRKEGKKVTTLRRDAVTSSPRQNVMTKYACSGGSRPQVTSHCTHDFSESLSGIVTSHVARITAAFERHCWW